MSFMKNVLAGVVATGGLFAGAGAFAWDGSLCAIQDGNTVVDVVGCLQEVQLESEMYMPILVSEDTTLSTMVAFENKMIQNYDVKYDGSVDFDDPEVFEKARRAYIRALPKTANKTCEKGTLTSALYNSGMVNEYRYRINDSEKVVSIIIDKKYCSDIGIPVD